MNGDEQILIYKQYVAVLSKFTSIFWYGIAIYGIATAVAATYSASLIKGVQVLQGIGIILVLYSVVNIIQFKVRNNFLGVLIFIYLSYSIFIIFHGIDFSYSFTKYLFFSSFIKYFFPLVLLIPKNMNFYKNIPNLILVHGIFFIVINLLFLDIVLTRYDENVVHKFTFEGFVQNLGVTSSFLLFTFIYHKKHKNIIAFVVLIIIMAISTYVARRAVMAMSILHMFIFFIIFFLYSNNKFITTVIFILVLSACVVYAPQFYKENKDSFFEKILERGAKDTRSGVEEAFIRDFETEDWIFGRGINGKYWCPNVDLNDTSGYRKMIETDYLNVILKGGIIYLSLIILLSFPAAIKAIFFSKNLLSKAAGIWIILWLISLYPLNVFTTDLNHVLFWVCVGIGYSKDMRNMSDENLRASFSE